MKSSGSLQLGEHVESAQISKFPSANRMKEPTEMQEL